jgi:uncharacterized damage-inducible protein DinB
MTCSEGNFDIFRQIQSTLLKLNAEQYSKPLDVFEGSTIGKHFRHIYDFYFCIEKSLKNGRLDYCERERHPLIETNPEFASLSFQKCLNALQNANDEQNLIVLADFSTNSFLTRPEVKSSVGRELMYAFDHAVHHLAIIKIGIRAAFPDIELEQDLGLAPSTKKYQEQVSTFI